MKTYNNIPAKRGQRPWGYSVSPDDHRVLVPDVAALTLLDEAFVYLDRDFSFRDVADWLTVHSGIPMSHVALFKQYRKHLKKFPRLARMSGQTVVINHG